MKNKSVFKIMCKFQPHGQNRVQLLRKVILLQSDMHYAILFMDLLIEYLRKASFRTSLAFQTSVLERFVKVFLNLDF